MNAKIKYSIPIIVDYRIKQAAINKYESIGMRELILKDFRMNDF